MLPFILAILFEVGVAPSFIGTLATVLFQFEGLLFWGAISGISEYIDVSADAANVQFVIGWVHYLINWDFPVTANAILYGAPFAVRLGAYLVTILPRWFTSNFKAAVINIFIFLFALFIVLMTAVVPVAAFLTPIYTYGLFQNFSLVGLLLIIWFWLFIGTVCLFFCYLSLALAIVRTLADANDDANARPLLLLWTGLVTALIDPIGFAARNTEGNVWVRRICRAFVVFGGLAYSPYAYFARYFYRTLASPFIIVGAMTRFLNNWSPEETPEITLQEASVLPVGARQFTLLALIIISKIRGLNIDVEALLDEDNLLYPVKLLFFAAHHFGSISPRAAEQYRANARGPATLPIRLWFIAGSFIYPYFFNFGLVSISVMGFCGAAALTAGLPTNPLYFAALGWPIISFLWCQVEKVRMFILDKAVESGETATFHEPAFWTPIRRRMTAIYWDAYMWACDATSQFNLVAGDHVIFYYFNSEGDKVEFRFRESPELTEEFLDSAGFMLHRFTNPNWQHYMAGLFIPLVILYFILLTLKNTVYTSIRRLVHYFIQVVAWMLFWIFVPDSFFVFLLAYTRKAKLHGQAYVDNAWPFETDDEQDLKEQLWASVRHIKWLAALFRFSFFSSEEADEFGVKLWPAMDPGARAKRLAWARSVSIRVLKSFDDLRLPEFIESQWASPTADDIKASYQSLKDMGWPIEQEFIDSIQTPSDDTYFNSWASLRTHLVAQSNYRLGLVRGRVGVPEELSHLQGLIWSFGQVTGYIHTVSYNSVEAEERSTSRYFTGGGSLTESFSDEEVDDLLDGLWAGVSSQFSFSKIASFDYVFKHWEKKFNMGFGFSKPGKSGVKKQLTRNQAIEITGGRRAFLALWADTFKKAASLVPVAPVFAKLETLKEKKYLQRAVRTVVGSAITHHIMTTVFNYLPNHNYQIWSTPMKVGMSFNGQNFGRLWQSLAKHTFVWAGDMTAFDSTVSPAVLKIVRDCRKKGYTTHADFHRICLLIDVAYEQLLKHPMGFKATGNIVQKEQGFTTGHSSTSPDNSLALVVTYLFAWRRVTGLRAREFYTYNTLANFGDDHVLGWEPVFGWSPTAAARAIAEIGCIMRDEAPTSISLPGRLTRKNALEAHKILGIEEDFDTYFAKLKYVDKHPLDVQFSFLAKIPLERSGRVNEELSEFGIDLPYEFATCHDPRRLVGKITGQIFLNTHPKIRRDRMISYMGLCAHHRDIYQQLVNAVHVIDRRYARIWRADGTWAGLKAPPSYREVMQQWYSESANVKVPVYADDEIDESMLDASDDLAHLLSNDGFVDNAVRFLADVPTIIAPRLGLPFWGEWLLVNYAPYFSWVYELVGFANHVSHSSLACMNIVDTTAYRIVSHPTVLNHVSQANTTTLYIRHWLFCIFSSTRARSNRANIFDLPKILDNYIAQWAFMLVGRTTNVIRGVDVDIIGMLAIAALGFLHFPDFLGRALIIWRDVPIISASQVVASLWYEFRRVLAPMGAIDMQPWLALVRNLRPGSPGWVVSAPTGVGKSTRMIADAQAATGKRIVVIQPRSVVVLGVSAFMRSIFPDVSIASCTEDGTGATNSQIVYCTPQYFFLSEPLRNTTNTIYILDEAHIDEPLYHAAIEWLRRMAPGFVLMTATPKPEWPENRNTLNIPCSVRFSVSEHEYTLASTAEYINSVVAAVTAVTDVHKVLIFVPTLAMGHTFAARLPSTSFIHSKNKTPDLSKRIFISTNVADAGLTIPDVAIVYSMDIDVFVSTSLDTGGLVNGLRHYRKTVRHGFRSLTPQTIRQRRGRTGRTCDGAFNLYRVQVQRDDRPDRFTTQDYVDAAGPALPIIAVLIDGLTEYVQERRQELGSSGPDASPWWERIASNFTKFIDDDDNQVNHFRTVEEFKDLNNNETSLDSIETFYLDDEELPEPEVVAVWDPAQDEPPTGVSTYAGVPNQAVFAGVPGVAGRDWGLDDNNPVFPPRIHFPDAFGRPTLDEFTAQCTALGLHPVKTYIFIRDRFSQDPILQDVPFKYWGHDAGFGFVVAQYLRTASEEYFTRLVISFHEVTAAARGDVRPDPVNPMTSLVTQAPLESNPPQEVPVNNKGKSLQTASLDEMQKFTFDNLGLLWDVEADTIIKILRHLHISETALLQAWTGNPEHYFFITPLAELEDTYSDEGLSNAFHRIFFGSQVGQSGLPS